MSEYMEKIECNEQSKELPFENGSKLVETQELSQSIKYECT